MIYIGIVLLSGWIGKTIYNKKQKQALKPYQKFCVKCLCSYPAHVSCCPICKMHKKTFFERIKEWKNKYMV